MAPQVTSMLRVQGIKLPFHENEDTIANCVLESTIKFFQRGYPVAVVPQIIHAIDKTDSERMFTPENSTLDTDNNCVPESTEFQKERVFKYLDISKFETHAIFFLSWSHIAENSLGTRHSTEFWPLFVASSRIIVPLNSF